MTLIQIFVKGKGLWGHVDGNTLAPNKDQDNVSYNKWGLRSDFESMQSNLMHRDLLPSLDACLNHLLREEQCLLT
ncbi:hypothetical protein CR513_53377, partial [Mucuna pruriens]